MRSYRKLETVSVILCLSLCVHSTLTGGPTTTTQHSADPPSLLHSNHQTVLNASRTLEWKRVKRLINSSRKRIQSLNSSGVRCVPFPRPFEPSCAQHRLTWPPFYTQHSGDSSTSQGELDKSTEATLAQINSSFDQHRDQVVAQLLDRVVQVDPSLHRNYKV